MPTTYTKYRLSTQCNGPSFQRRKGADPQKVSCAILGADRGYYLHPTLQRALLLSSSGKLQKRKVYIQNCSKREVRTLFLRPSPQENKKKAFLLKRGGRGRRGDIMLSIKGKERSKRCKQMIRGKRKREGRSSPPFSSRTGRYFPKNKTQTKRYFCLPKKVAEIYFRGNMFQLYVRQNSSPSDGKGFLFEKESLRSKSFKCFSGEKMNPAQ